eukprot:SAG22_NODE_15262_length_353_cov_0.618110_1_plen_87_part_10
MRVEYEHKGNAATCLVEREAIYGPASRLSRQSRSKTVPLGPQIMSGTFTSARPSQPAVRRVPATVARPSATAHDLTLGGATQNSGRG